VNGKSIMGVTMLELLPAKIVTIEASGADERAALQEIASLFLYGFSEQTCPDFERFLDDRSSNKAQPLQDEGALTLLVKYAQNLRTRGACLHNQPCE
jgi:PTS HPr component phosphorylation site